MTTLLVGHGLLGRRVRTGLERAGDRVVVARVPWDDPEAARRALLAAARGTHGPWRLAWCAGAGVVSTSADALADEVALVRGFVADLASPGASAHAVPEGVLVASSAGGVYAGSSGAPFTERHEPRPLAAYGVAKLEVESALVGLAEHGTRVAVARFANLYGPGQNLAKAQGLVSALCRSRVLNEPMTVYVPADTMRDYVYVDDAAAVAVAMLGRVCEEPAGTVVTKIVASGRPTTVSGMVGFATRAFRRRPPVVYAAREGTGQVHDLRLRSVVWTDLDALVSTPTVVGLRATADDVAARIRSRVVLDPQPAGTTPKD